MNCHKCIHLTYQKNWLGRCTLPDHADRFFQHVDNGPRKDYAKEPCADFEPINTCSDCQNWHREKYKRRDPDSPHPAKGFCTKHHVKLMHVPCAFFIPVPKGKHGGWHPHWEPVPPTSPCPTVQENVKLSENAQKDQKND